MTTRPTPPLVFGDLETTGLDPDQHTLWEIALIRRDPDGTDTEYLWQIRLTEIELEHAEPEALRINRYHERKAVPDRAFAADMLTPGGPAPISLADLSKTLHHLLKGAVLLGSNPGFDAGFLRVFLDGAPWHYRPIDVPTRADGYLWATRPRLMASRTGPISSRWVSQQMGVEPPGPDDAHQALVDARWMRDLNDAVLLGGAR